MSGVTYLIFGSKCRIILPILKFLPITIYDYSYVSLTLRECDDHLYILTCTTFCQPVKDYFNLDEDDVLDQ